MEKKYSTGTKGRLKKHADDCTAVVRLACQEHSLALEFIKLHDPDYKDSNWQKFTSVAQCKAAVAEWLGEEPPKEDIQTTVNVETIKETLAKRAKTDKFIAHSEVMTLLDQESNWIASPEGLKELEVFSKEEALTYIIGRLQIKLEEH